MRLGRSAQSGATSGDVSSKTGEISRLPRWRRTGVTFRTWLAVAGFAGALGLAACGSTDSGGPGSPGTGGAEDSGTDATVDARPEASSGGADSAADSTTAPESGSSDSSAMDTARADSTADVGVADSTAPDGAATDGSAHDAQGPCIFDGGDAPSDCCVDGDGDGVPDCIDVCVTDPTKTTSAGVCGCNVPDVDTDGDGVDDCVDGCPKDRTRSQPGPCGCGFPDNTPLCLVHRYSFNDRSSADAGSVDAGEGGAGGMVADSINHADGIALNLALTGTGSLTLAGGTSNQYVVLPSGILSALGDNVTIEAWLTWPGTGGAWQRVFDFGSSSAGPGLQGTGTAFLFATPLSGTGFLLSSFVTANGGLAEADSTGLFPIDAAMHEMAVVVSTPAADAGTTADGGGPTLTLYLDGVVKGRVPTSSKVSAVPDVNNWLGRSQFTADPNLQGTYFEFRIYSAARSDAQITASTAAGPDALPAQ
jgi:hypothetical protein